MIQAIYSYWTWMLLLTYLQLRSLLRIGQKREAIVSTCLMGVALVYGTLVIANIDFPSPLLPLRWLFERFGKKLLQQ